MSWVYYKPFVEYRVAGGNSYKKVNYKAGNALVYYQVL